MSIIKTDRKEVVNTPPVDTNKKDETKTEMKAVKGGGSTISDKQLITIIIVLVVIAVLVVLSVYFYKRHQKIVTPIA